MAHAELPARLCCPETRQPLSKAAPQTIAKVNELIAAGQLRNRSGALLQDPITDGFLRADGKFLYPIRNGIPILLVSEGIAL